jgi:hypothetical protein
MRCLIVVLLSLALACTKKEPPEASEPTAAAVAESEAPSETTTQTEPAEAASPFDQAELPGELRGPAPPLGEPPTIKVLEPGGNPSHQLRWDVKPGFEQTLELQVRFRIEAISGGGVVVSFAAPWRSTTYKIKLKAEEVEPGGALRVALAIDELSSRYGEGTNATQDARLKKAVTDLRGLRGSYTVNPRGWIENIELGVPADAIREAHDMVDNVKWALYQMTPSFPEERVDEGAKWTAQRGVMQRGIAVNQLATTTILEIEGARVNVRTDLRQAAHAQPFNLPGHPVPFELGELVAEGTSEAWWDLTKLAPRTASVTSTVTKHYSATQGGEKVSMIETTIRTATMSTE